MSLDGDGRAVPHFMHGRPSSHSTFENGRTDFQPSGAEASGATLVHQTDNHAGIRVGEALLKKRFNSLGIVGNEVFLFRNRANSIGEILGCGLKWNRPNNEANAHETVEFWNVCISKFLDSIDDNSSCSPPPNNAEFQR